MVGMPSTAMDHPMIFPQAMINMMEAEDFAARRSIWGISRNVRLLYMMPAIRAITHATAPDSVGVKIPARTPPTITTGTRSAGIASTKAFRRRLPLIRSNTFGSWCFRTYIRTTTQYATAIRMPGRIPAKNSILTEHPVRTL